MTATRRTAVPVDKKGVLLKKKSIRAQRLSGKNQAANGQTAQGQTTIITASNPKFQIFAISV
jgi:threonine/homoserine/homoserine lactone efflux protein